jgi:cytochrome c551/c552
MISTKRLYVFGALLCAALGTTSAQADPMVELAVGSGCFICHSIDAKSGSETPLAPSYRAIAARYKDRNDAFTYLTQRVLRGTVYGEQNWSGGIGMRFMPPNLNVDSKQAAALVNWILALDISETADTPALKHERMLTTATTSGCLACHHIYPNRDPRMVPLAPAFADIGKRFGGRQADAVKELTNSVLRGTQASNKKWHEANMQFMPPNVALEPGKAKELVEWILTLK